MPEALADRGLRLSVAERADRTNATASPRRFSAHGAGSGVGNHPPLHCSSRLGDWLVPGDLFVANNSRVIPARLHGIRVPSWRRGGDSPAEEKQGLAHGVHLANPRSASNGVTALSSLRVALCRTPARQSSRRTWEAESSYFRFDGRSGRAAGRLRAGTRSAVYQPRPGRCGRDTKRFMRVCRGRPRRRRPGCTLADR